MIGKQIEADGVSAEIQYSSYILRLWRESSDGTLRATLKDVRDGSTRNFTTISPLVEFLTAQTDQTGEKS